MKIERKNLMKPKNTYKKPQNTDKRNKQTNKQKQLKSSHSMLFKVFFKLLYQHIVPICSQDE